MDPKTVARPGRDRARDHRRLDEFTGAPKKYPGTAVCRRRHGNRDRKRLRDRNPQHDEGILDNRKLKRSLTGPRRVRGGAGFWMGFAGSARPNRTIEENGETSRPPAIAWKWLG